MKIPSGKSSSFPNPQSILMAVATAPAAAAQLSQKTHDSVGAADLEKVTDYAPEKEISGDIGKVYLTYSK